MIPILYEDKYIIIVHKPVDMPVSRDFSRSQDMMTEVENYLKLKPHLIHRLDRHVSGPIVLAKDKKSAASLSGQVSAGGFTKCYIAVVEGKSKKTENLVSYIKKEKQLAVVVSQEKYDTMEGQEKSKYKKATLTYHLLQPCSDNKDRYLLGIELGTGRFHQIRAQLSYAGLKIVGDPKYGIKEGNYIGLQCVKLGIKHPITNKNIEVSGYHTFGPFKKFEVKNEEFVRF